MDDLEENITNGSRVLLYADDDCKLLGTISSMYDAKSIQEDIKCFETWCKLWKRQINPSKNVAM